MVTIDDFDVWLVWTKKKNYFIFFAFRDPNDLSLSLFN